jgi:Sporulation and spore germination/Immunoglobulin-like domain of bacterial spore germination
MSASKETAMKPLVLALSAVCLAFAVAACGGDGESAGPAPPPPVEPEPPATSAGATTEEAAETEPPAPAETEPAETFTFEVWFARDAGTLTGEGGTEIALGPLLFSTSRTAETTPQVARIALETLLEGATPEEVAAGISTAIPAGTRLLGVSIEDGIATVDLSSEFESGGGSLSMMLRLAQVVFTVTQFPTVEGVQFELDGQPVETFSGEGIVLDQPVTREDYEDLMPMITVEAPTVGSPVESPVLIAGTANVFEATVTARVLDAAGNVLVEDFTTATCGTGCRGNYEIELPFSALEEQPGTIQLQADDAAGTGTMPGLVEIPVTLIP